MQFPLGKLKTRLELRTDIKYCAWLRLNRMTCTYFILAGLSVLCVRAFFPGWFSIVPPDRRLRISGSMHTAGVVRTLKWVCRCTSNKISHTLPVCQEEKGLGKKKSFSLHPDGVHSDPPSVSSSVLPSTSQTCGSASPLLSAHQWEITPWKAPHESLHKLKRTSAAVTESGEAFHAQTHADIRHSFQDVTTTDLPLCELKRIRLGWGGRTTQIFSDSSSVWCGRVQECVCGFCLCVWVLVKVNLWGWTSSGDV